METARSTGNLTNGWYSLRWLLVLFAAAAALITAWQAQLHPPMNPEVECCDHLFYRSMVYNLWETTRPDLNLPPDNNPLHGIYQDPYHAQWLEQANGLNRQPPYVYRVATPLLVRAVTPLFAGDLHRGFYAVTFAALFLAAFVMAILIYLITRSTAAALLGILATGANYWIFGFNLNHFMLADPVALSALALATLFMFLRMPRAFFLTVLIGVFAKEIAIALVPAYFMYEWMSDGRVRLSSLVYAGLVGVSYAAFRVLLPIPVPTYSLAATFLPPSGILDVGVWIFVTFGVLAAFASSRIWFSKFAISLLPLALAALTAAFFATNRERAIIYAFPVVIIAVLSVPATTSRDRVIQLAPIPAWFLALVLQPYAGWKYVALGSVAVYLAIEFLFFRERLQNRARHRHRMFGAAGSSPPHSVQVKQ